MKRDYSTFVSLPQKTSLLVSTPANIIKTSILFKGMLLKNIKNYFSTIKVDQMLATDLIKFKLRIPCDSHSIFKYC